MRRIIILLLMHTIAFGQQKQPAKVLPQPTDSIASKALINEDTLDPLDQKIKASRQFAVYSKRENGVDKRLKLCFQLNGDTVLNYCINDSTCRFPEVYKELFRKKDGDTTYVLLFVDAFSKGTEKLCDGRKETKLIFVTWNTAKNKAKVKMRTIASCVKGITNMTKNDIASWEGKEPLVVNYYKGRDKFIDVKFDPAEYKKGMQTFKAPVGEDMDEE